jgi:hypothetical protein
LGSAAEERRGLGPNLLALVNAAVSAFELAAAVACEGESESEVEVEASGAVRVTD